MKIWNEDSKDNPIHSTMDLDCKLLCGTWCWRSIFVGSIIGRADGILGAWDVLVDLKEPLVSLKVNLIMTFAKNTLFLGHRHCMPTSNKESYILFFIY